MNEKLIRWTEEDVAKLAANIPELMACTVPGERARMIDACQVELLGVEKKRTVGSIHASLYPGKKLHTMLLTLQAATARVKPAATRHGVVKLRRVEWTALAHHPQIKPLLDSKVFVTPNQLAAALERAQRDVLPEDRWRTLTRWHSAIYRKSRHHDDKKCDALSLLRDGIKYQPLTVFVPEAPAPEPTPDNKIQETNVSPTISVPPPTAAEGIVQAVATLLQAVQAQAAAAYAPMMERLGKLEAVVAALPAAIGAQVADVVGGPQPAQPVGVPVIELPCFQPERLPRVDVVGLLGNQAEVVKRACGRQWDLRFISADDALRRPITAPDAIMLSKFVTHDVQDRIKKAGARLHYCNGAAESVINQLNALATSRMN